VDEDFWQTLPSEFDAKTYRSIHGDLARFTDADLQDHYNNFGCQEGRRAHGLDDRTASPRLFHGARVFLRSGHSVIRFYAPTHPISTCCPQERREVHTLRSVIECRALTTHNDSFRHWLGDHGVEFENFEQRLRAALQEFNDAQGKYIDVHAWYFTPDSASAILSTLHSLKLSPSRFTGCIRRGTVPMSSGWFSELEATPKLNLRLS